MQKINKFSLSSRLIINKKITNIANKIKTYKIYISASHVFLHCSRYINQFPISQVCINCITVTMPQNILLREKLIHCVHNFYNFASIKGTFVPNPPYISAFKFLGGKREGDKIYRKVLC